MRFYTDEKLGEHQALTPEGFLLCESVPLARTGSMYYAAHEVIGKDGEQLEADASGAFEVVREADDVFAPAFIASFAGKPFCNDHPPEDVRPDNWKRYTDGTILNPRRGEGAQADLLVGDIIVFDPQAITDIRNGKREVSCGYDAFYEQIAPGRLKQIPRWGNHVALVDEGRCGMRCSISDHRTTEMKTGDCSMKANDKAGSGWMDKIRSAFKAKDEGKLEEALEEAKAKDTDEEEAAEKKKREEAEAAAKDRKMTDADINTRFATLDKKIDDGVARLLDSVKSLDSKLTDKKPVVDEKDDETEKELEEEAGTKDARKARDSEHLADSFQEAVAGAEILAPGIRISSTYDRAAEPKKTLDAICKLRRNALDLAYITPEGRGMIEELNGKPLMLDAMTCGAVRQLFRSTVAMKKAANNARRTGDDNGSGTAAGTGVKGLIRTQADLNKRNHEHYNRT